MVNRSICPTPRFKRPDLACAVTSQHPSSRGAVGSSKVWQKATRRTDINSISQSIKTDLYSAISRKRVKRRFANWQVRDLGRHRHWHSGSVLSRSDIRLVWCTGQQRRLRKERRLSSKYAQAIPHLSLVQLCAGVLVFRCSPPGAWLAILSFCFNSLFLSLRHFTPSGKTRKIIMNNTAVYRVSIKSTPCNCCCYFCCAYQFL